MKKFLLLLLTVATVCSVRGQDIPKFGDIKQDFPEMSRKDYRQAVSEYNEQINEGYKVSLSPIERVVIPVPKARGIVPQAVDSWGRKVVMPDAIKSRVVNECGQYPVVIKIMDSGIDPLHNEYAGAWWMTSSNYSGDTERHWHGTHVAGIVWQLVGDVTRSKRNFRLKDVQILNRNGSGSISNIVNAAATEYAQDKALTDAGAGVIYNNSWGAQTTPISSMENEIRKSVALGVVWTAAAGNTGTQSEHYPANSPNVIAVGALNDKLQRASFSTYNDFVWCALPGQSIVSTLPNNSQGIASGTSMADPFATAVMSMAMGKYGPILHSQSNMEKYVAYIATDLSPDGKDIYTGWGIDYVVKMLDTDPCDVPGISCDGEDPGDDPGDDPDDPTDPEPDPSLTETHIQHGAAFMRYKYNNSQDWLMLSISNVEVYAVGEGDQNSFTEKLSEWLPSYFLNRGIGFTTPSEFGAYDAVKWTGIFLQYIANQAGLEVEVQRIEAYDETTGQHYVCTDFSRSQSLVLTRGTGTVESLDGPKLIPIK